MASQASRLIHSAQHVADCNLILRLYDEGHPTRIRFADYRLEHMGILHAAPQAALSSAIALSDYNSDAIQVLQAERDRRIAAGEWE